MWLETSGRNPRSLVFHNLYPPDLTTPPMTVHMNYFALNFIPKWREGFDKSSLHFEVLWGLKIHHLHSQITLESGGHAHESGARECESCVSTGLCSRPGHYRKALAPLLGVGNSDAVSKETRIKPHWGLAWAQAKDWKGTPSPTTEGHSWVGKRNFW